MKGLFGEKRLKNMTIQIQLSCMSDADPGLQDEVVSVGFVGYYFTVKIKFRSNIVRGM